MLSPKVITAETPFHEVRHAIAHRDIDDVDAVVGMLSSQASEASQKPLRQRFRSVGLLTEVGKFFPHKAGNVAEALFRLAEAEPDMREVSMTGIGVLASHGCLDEGVVLPRVQIVDPSNSDHIRGQFKSARVDSPPPQGEPVPTVSKPPKP